jgi:hypothetical protein
MAAFCQVDENRKVNMRHALPDHKMRPELGNARNRQHGARARAARLKRNFQSRYGLPSADGMSREPGKRVSTD